MAGVSTPELAAAVSNAGALGALGLGASNWQSAVSQVDAFRALSDGPLHVNFFCHDEPERNPTLEAAWITRFTSEFASLRGAAPDSLKNPYTSAKDDPQLIDFAREYRPDLISFHFGLPNTTILTALRELGIPIITSVTHLDDAALALNAGVDGLIAQGIEAGGHRGTFDPCSDLDFSVNALPIVAAGGIMNGVDAARALSASADAVQLGSAFLLCPESGANADYRDQIRTASGSSTVVTRAISGRAARGIDNKLTAIGDKANKVEIPPYPITYDLSKQLNARALEQQGSGYGAYWAGTGIGQARELSANDLIDQLVEELAAVSQRQPLPNKLSS
ncbi:MAG: nitronate monooxygenase [Proteobacteria bacterium]|nr:MAG: nitronate monooxygenase [Pseudomonadota bacterium]